MAESSNRLDSNDPGNQLDTSEDLRDLTVAGLQDPNPTIDLSSELSQEHANSNQQRNLNHASRFSLVYSH